MKNTLLSWKKFFRLIAIQTLCLCAVVAVFGFSLRTYFKHQYISRIQLNMKDLLESLSHQMPLNVDESWCKKVSKDTQFRLSVISTTDGRILCDTVYSRNTMEPLLNRPEVLSALEAKNSFGFTIRFSPTLNENAYYGTKYIPEKSLVLRTGTRLSDLSAVIGTFDQMLAVSMLVLAIVLSGVLVIFGTKLLFPYANSVVEKTAQHMREDFVANVSHELRTPLTSIKGFADTVIGDINENRPVEKEFVEIISQDASRLLGLVNEILDLSALDSGSMQLNLEPVDLKKTTQAVLARLNTVYGSKAQTVRASYEVESATLDPDRITQILVNLVGNAQKYSPDGCEIQVAWLSGPENGVTLQITDNGPGMSQEEQVRVFERFYRGEAGAANLERGSGLGLSIVKHLVSLHSGKIELSSVLGKGSQFRLSFPSQVSPVKS